MDSSSILKPRDLLGVLAVQPCIFPVYGLSAVNRPNHRVTQSLHGPCWGPARAPAALLLLGPARGLLLLVRVLLVLLVVLVLVVVLLAM